VSSKVTEQLCAPRDRVRVVDTSNVINLGLFILTGMGVLVAGRQAGDARRAREDAQDARDEAKAHEAAALKAAQDSADSSNRAADALERSAFAAEAAVVKPDISVEQITAHRWKVTNESGFILDFIEFGSRPPDVLTIEEGSAQTLAPGASTFIGFGGGVTDPTHVTVDMSYRHPIRQGQSTIFTLP
jgi:hypothetical protein